MLKPSPSTITPDFVPHADLEADVTAYLNTVGFITHEATYHTTMDSQLASLLKTRYSPTALHLRGRADRIAVHLDLPIEFEYECKTHHPRSRWGDMTLEALPLLHHVIKARLGVRCLYVYRDAERDIECGFWTDSLPHIRDAWIPARWVGSSALQWFRQALGDLLDTVTVRDYGRTNGSGDPFVVVAEETARGLPHWKELVATLMRGTG